MRHLVVGAGGSFGSAVVAALLRRGEQVRALVRNPASVSFPAEVEVVAGDAMVLSTLTGTAKDCDTIFHAANVPVVRWDPDLVRITDNIVEASGLTGATLVFPGSVHGTLPVPGVPLPPQIAEPTPWDGMPLSARVRQSIELQVQQNTEVRNIRGLIVRSNDWFGAGVRSPFIDATRAAARAGQALPWYGDPSAAHVFASVADVADVAVAVLLMPDRPPFEVINVGGHLFENAAAWAEAVSQAAGRKLGLAVHRSWEIKLRSYFSAEARVMRDFLPQWEGPLILDDTATSLLVPNYRLTSVADAMKGMLAG